MNGLVKPYVYRPGLLCLEGFDSQADSLTSEEIVKGPRGLLVHGRCDMTVEVERDSNL